MPSWAIYGNERRMGPGPLAPSTVLLNGSESDGINLLAGTNGMTSGWTTIQSSLTNATGPDSGGGNAASSLIDTNANSRHIIYQELTPLAANTPRTFSVYALVNGRRYLQLQATATGTTYSYFDLLSGVVTDSGATAGGTLISTNIQAAVGGFYKCSMTYQDTGTDTFLEYSCSTVSTFGAPLDFNSPQYIGDLVSGYYLWRPKLAL